MNRLNHDRLAVHSGLWDSDQDLRSSPDPAHPTAPQTEPLRGRGSGVSCLMQLLKWFPLAADTSCLWPVAPGSGCEAQATQLMGAEGAQLAGCQLRGVS